MKEYSGTLDGRGLRIAIAASRFNERVVRTLVDGARDALVRLGVADDHIELAWVPGAFELPTIAAAFAGRGDIDAVVCLGAVIRGETPHFDYVAGGAATGIARVAADSGVPVVFGVLTTNDAAQADARAGGKAGNKGVEAAQTAVEMVQLLRVVAKRGPHPEI